MIADGNFADLCKQLKDIGVERIELCSAIGYNEFAKLADAKETKKIIADHGMKCESAHFSMRELRDDQQKSIDWAKEIGIKQMMTASLGGPVKDGTTTMDAVKKAADEYNKIGEVASQDRHPAGTAQRRLRAGDGGWRARLRHAVQAARSRSS